MSGRRGFNRPGLRNAAGPAHRIGRTASMRCGHVRIAVARLVVVDDRDLILPAEPAAKVDQLAALGAEREVRLHPVAGRVDSFFADGTEQLAHGATLRICRSSSRTTRHNRAASWAVALSTDSPG